MDSNLKDKVLHICNTLNKHSVQYIIIGGTAVALHGYFRHSISLAGKTTDKPDLDFWYNPIYDNYFKLLNALQELGEDVSAFKAEKTPNPKESFFKFEYPDFTLDFLPLIGDEKFRDLFERREVAKIDETEIYFLAYKDLIANKIKTSRPKDLEDIKQLQQIRKDNPE